MEFCDRAKANEEQLVCHAVDEFQHNLDQR